MFRCNISRSELSRKVVLEDKKRRSEFREFKTEEDCIRLKLFPQVRLANIGGDVLAIGGMALDLLDSVEQVSDKG